MERIVRRDYPANVAGEILDLIASISVREKPRVVLACLKIASGYYWELLSEAEYPLATKRWSRIQSLPEDEVRAIYDKDWRQYSEWLTRA